MVDKSQASFLKYILGVNRYSSNLAVMSEIGRLSMHLSVTISIVKYLHRLENASDGLLLIRILVFRQSTCIMKVCRRGIHRLHTFFNC